MGVEETQDPNTYRIERFRTFVKRFKPGFLLSPEILNYFDLLAYKKPLVNNYDFIVTWATTCKFVIEHDFPEFKVGYTQKEDMFIFERTLIIKD